MRPRLLSNLICPNFGVSDFGVYGHELFRGGLPLHELTEEQIRPDDDIKEGFIFSKSAGTVYPIREFVLSMLADSDADQRFYESALLESVSLSPAAYASVIRASVARMRRVASGSVGQWNQEEMAYYDREVAEVAMRRRLLGDVRTRPLWHIYLERSEHLVNKIDWEAEQKVLEIGCGNARTLSWLRPPGKVGYSYTGTDISFKRLILAKTVIPDGDFVQCSALNLPFKDATFSTAVSFGVLHHLPDPIAGVRECLRTLKDGGVLAMHEPIEKPKLLPDGNFTFVRKALTTYQHSQHDNEIDLQAVMKLTGSERLAVKHRHLSGSALRTLLARIIKLSPRLSKSRTAWRLIIFLDKIAVKLLCFRPNAIGPKAVYLVLEKTRESCKPVAGGETARDEARPAPPPTPPRR